MINREKLKRSSLRDALLDKDLKFQSPLHFLDSSDMYTNSLRISIIQLILVRGVLQADLTAAKKVASHRVS